MKLLLDMNISPKLVHLLLHRQIETKHWSVAGRPDATDAEIMSYAKNHNFVVVTYDLDFSAILSANQAKKPSVIQIRKQGVQLTSLADLLATSVRQLEKELEDGSILTLDAKHSRVRSLPFAAVYVTQLQN